MTQKEKQLLLKDLCARLPYGVKFQGEDSNVYTLDAANYFALQVEDMVFKPYLRAMSSMTSDERFEYDELQHFYTHGLDFNVDEIDWLNAHHFDYRGLIEKGLALEAPEGMYKKELDMTKEEAMVELKDLLDYWKYVKMYDNKREQDAVEFAIKYLEEN